MGVGIWLCWGCWGAPALHAVFYNHLPACVVHCCTRQTKRFQDTCTVVGHRSFMFFFEV